MMGSARVQGWRGAMASLRASSSPLPLLLSTAVSQLSAHISATSELPPHEVAGDIVSIIQAVPTNWLHFEASEYWSTCPGICRLVVDLSSRIQLECKPGSVVVLVRFLRRVLEGSNSSWAGAPDNDAGRSLTIQGAKTEWEAAKALVQIIHEHGSHIPGEEVSLLLCVLLRLVQEPGFATPDHCKKFSKALAVRTDTGHAEVRSKYWQDSREYYRLLFTAIGNLFTRAGSLVSKENWALSIKVFRVLLEFMVSTKLEEDAAASRCYAAVLRCVHLVLLDSKSALAEHISSFVGTLRAFFMYGLPNSGISPVYKVNQGQGAAMKSGSWRDSKAESHKNGAYRPPHMRGKPPGKTGNVDVLGSDFEAQGGWGIPSSDSELSDNDGQHEEGDRFKSSKVRTNSVLSIQALARSDPKVLHAHWVLLLPTQDVLQPRPFQATLLTILLFDPIMKTRLAAASTIAVMLEGPARAFLQVAEHKEISRSKSFTTLSSSLGQLVIQLLIGLVHVFVNESHSGLLVGTLKGLSLLLSASPFSRLPPEILPYVVCSVHQKARNFFSSSADQSTVMCAAINCLGAALSSTPPSDSVAVCLVMETPPVYSTRGLSVHCPSCSHLLLPDLISYTLPPTSTAVRVEAFQALKAAVHTYPSIVSNYWELISRSILGTIKHGHRGFGLGDVCDSFAHSQMQKVVLPLGVVNGQTAKFADDKVAHSAMKLLDEFLRATCGFKVTDEFADDGLMQPPAPFLVPKPGTLLTASGVSSSKNDTDSFQSSSIDCGTAVGLWLDALNNHLPPTLVHAAPMVRGVALTCFAGLTNMIFISLPLDKQDWILSSVISAAWNDDTPAVRSAACRAIGVVIGFPQVAGSKAKLDLAVDVVVSSTSDTSVSVRITASWALANICDALRNIAETDSLVHHQDTSGTMSLAVLAECALKAAKDCDKVRANAVRALGNLARFASFSGQYDLQTRSQPEGVSQEHQQISTTPPDSIDQGASQPSRWLGVMVQTLVSCVTTGNVKVQWNVCHALGNLFLNKTICLPKMIWVPSVYSILLLLLRDSANFKIRIHSAAALAVPASREDYGDSYGDVVKALVHALECMNPENESAPTSFKYVTALTDQLTTTILHMLGLGLPQDFFCFKDFLLKKVTFFTDFLTALWTLDGKSNLSDTDVNDKGILDQMAEDNLTEMVNSKCCVYDEKPLPPPKEHRRYGLQMNDSMLTLNCGLDQKGIYLRKAVRAVAAMYRYGGVVSATEKLEVLIL